LDFFEASFWAMVDDLFGNIFFDRQFVDKSSLIWKIRNKKEKPSDG